jgi:rod shape determining protein RodA
MIDRRNIIYFDWISFCTTVSILSVGLLFVLSSTTKEIFILSPFFKKQLFGAVSGIFIYLIFSFINLETICRWAYFGYFFIILLLGYTMFCGFVGMGAKRWVSLYFITFQPSETVKVALPLCFAFYFNEQKNISGLFRSPPLSKFLLPITLLFLTFILILKQPDLGTALIVMFSGLIVFWVANIPKKFFIAIILLGTIGAPVLWKQLKPYQKDRVLALLGYGDSKKERYQMEQSKIAIGSGGLFGKGLLRGTQNRLSFLPEARTDFIFSVLCEEWGFIGALFVLLLFSLLFIRITLSIIKSKILLEQLVGIGLLAPIMLSTVINIGMVSGMFPIVGIPLPLFTYGVTNLWITCTSLGIINNISIRQTSAR